MYPDKEERETRYWEATSSPDHRPNGNEGMSERMCGEDVPDREKSTAEVLRGRHDLQV